MIMLFFHQKQSHVELKKKAVSNVSGFSTFRKGKTTMIDFTDAKSSRGGEVGFITKLIKESLTHVDTADIESVGLLQC